MTRIPVSDRAPMPGRESHAARHPLAGIADREGLAMAHLGIADASPPLPLMLLRAEVAPQKAGDAHALAIRIGVIADARALPGLRHVVRAMLTLHADSATLGVLRVEAGKLEWQGAKASTWHRVPMKQSGTGYAGRAAALVEALQAWARSPSAGPALAAALRAGAASTAASSGSFDADAAQHEAEATKPGRTEAYRRRALAWAALQRGFAAQQLRNGRLLEKCAEGMPETADPTLAHRLLVTWMNAVDRQAQPRERAGRRAAKEAEKRAARQAAARDAAAALARLETAAPVLAAALETLLDAHEGRDKLKALPEALAHARTAVAQAREGAPSLAPKTASRRR